MTALIIWLLTGFAGLHVEAVDDAEHYVARHGLAPCLDTSLGVDGGIDMLGRTEYVGGGEFEGYGGALEVLGQGGVPHILGGVHNFVGIAAAEVGIELCVQFHVGRELEEGTDERPVLIPGHVVEVLAPGMLVTYCG